MSIPPPREGNTRKWGGGGGGAGASKNCITVKLYRVRREWASWGYCIKIFNNFNIFSCTSKEYSGTSWKPSHSVLLIKCECNFNFLYNLTLYTACTKEEIREMEGIRIKGHNRCSEVTCQKRTENLGAGTQFKVPEQCAYHCSEQCGLGGPPARLCVHQWLYRRNGCGDP